VTIRNIIDVGGEAYRKITGSDSEDYLAKNISKKELKNIFFDYFQYKDSFNTVNLVEYLYANNPKLKKMKETFEDCQESQANCPNQEFNLKEINNKPDQEFFKKIINKNTGLSKEAIIGKDKIEERFYEALLRIKENITTVLKSTLEYNKRDNDKIFSDGNMIESANQSNLQAITASLTNKAIDQLFQYLSYDFYFFQQMVKAISDFAVKEKIELQELKDDFFKKKTFDDLKTFINQEKLSDLNKDYFKTIFDYYINLNNKILNTIKNNQEQLIQFYSIYFSFPFDFSLFQNQDEFENYLEFLYYAYIYCIKKDSLPSIESANLLIQCFKKTGTYTVRVTQHNQGALWNQLSHIRNGFFTAIEGIKNKVNVSSKENNSLKKMPIEKIYFDYDDVHKTYRKLIIHKNFKNLILLYKLKQNNIEDKINISDEASLFHLFYNNLISFNFDQDVQYDKNKENDLNKLNQMIKGGKCTKDGDHIFLELEDFLKKSLKNKVFSELFFMSDLRKENGDFIDLNKDQRWTRLGKLPYVDDEIPLFDLKAEKSFIEKLIEIVNGYNKFLDSVSYAVAVIVLQDFYDPLSRAGYHLKGFGKRVIENKKKIIFFGGLLGGLSLLYTYRQRELPQFIFKQGRKIVPLIQEYFPKFKHTFFTATSKVLKR
jgi:hypothetical protein